MNKIFTLLFLLLLTCSVKAQQAVSYGYDEPYGKVDIADLQMKACDFEKDANAEVLIDEANLAFEVNYNISIKHHKRIKIFNVENSRDIVNIRLPYISANNHQRIYNLEAETINLTDGKVEITKLDKKDIFRQTLDSYRSELIFAMPNIKPGCIIDFKYTWDVQSFYDVPIWYFQDVQRIPVRYSAFNTKIPNIFYFTGQTRHKLAISKDSTWDEGAIKCESRVMTNVPSLPAEPSMRSIYDDIAGITLTLLDVTIGSTTLNMQYPNNWKKVGEAIVSDDDFGKQFKKKLTGEDVLIDKAKSFKTTDETVAYLFNEVKSTMKWNKQDYPFTDVGISKAWDAKTGNATEINLILFHLLKKSGVVSYPLLISTRDHGKVIRFFASASQFNRAVVYVPVTGGAAYVLDASDKYNTYNQIPFNLLNSPGLTIDADNTDYHLIPIENDDPVTQSVFVTAEISADGKINGTAELNSPAYNKTDAVKRYKTDGEEKFKDYLRDNDNNLTITSLKLDGMDVDTLPLVQDIGFKLDLAGGDDKYIYFNPALFSPAHKNPFLSETRNTDIDFGYRDNLFLNGIYKIPAGFKVDAMPQSVTMMMPDSSMTFTRRVGEQDGTIVVRYNVDHKKTVYPKEDYSYFFDFCKKMFELLNEQIVLKKI